MGQLEDLQAKGFGADGGKQYTVDNDITPLKKRVLVSDMHFGETKTAGGLIIPDDDGKAGGVHPRWAKVYAIGKDQDDVEVGEWVMVAHGRWSRAFKVSKNGIELEVRMIDENDILSKAFFKSKLASHSGKLNSRVLEIIVSSTTRASSRRTPGRNPNWSQDC